MCIRDSVPCLHDASPACTTRPLPARSVPCLYVACGSSRSGEGNEETSKKAYTSQRPLSPGADAPKLVRQIVSLSHSHSALPLPPASLSHSHSALPLPPPAFLSHSHSALPLPPPAFLSHSHSALPLPPASLSHSHSALPLPPPAFLSHSHSALPLPPASLSHSHSALPLPPSRPSMTGWAAVETKHDWVGSSRDQA
ncbi:putative proline-rich protein 21 [Hyalella azteca]|uniref:Proline-rich protein 21 n=1 Tax=Hyalella azteca TaxID=294128 RepID=A0A8B7NKL5_HYAAZ|nr:putative proline-rich protein 21 [Hyalella azteca]